MRATLLAFACVLLWARQAAAEPQVRWEAPRECPAPDEGRAEIARLLGRSLSTIAVDLTADVRILRAANGELEATISIRTGRGSRRRSLRDARCAPLTQAAAVVVALAIDPATPAAPPGRASSAGAAEREGAPATPLSPPPSSELTQQPDPYEPSTAPPAAPEPEPRAAPQERRQHEPSARPGAARPENELERKDPRLPPAPAGDSASAAGRASAVRWFLAGAAALGFGILPRPGATFAASTGLFSPAWCGALRVSYAPEHRAELSALSGVSGRVGLTSATIDLGRRLPFHAVEVPLLAGLEAGWFKADGEGVSDRRTQRRLLLSPHLASGIMLVWPEMFAVGIRLETSLALRRPRFAVQSSAGELRVFHRPELVGGRALLEFETRFR